jgi:hypothetical protein
MPFMSRLRFPLLLLLLLLHLLVLVLTLLPLPWLHQFSTFSALRSHPNAIRNRTYYHYIMCTMLIACLLCVGLSGEWKPGLQLNSNAIFVSIIKIDFIVSLLVINV